MRQHRCADQGRGKRAHRGPADGCRRSIRVWCVAGWPERASRCANSSIVLLYANPTTGCSPFAGGTGQSGAPIHPAAHPAAGSGSSAIYVKCTLKQHSTLPLLISMAFAITFATFG